MSDLKQTEKSDGWMLKTTTITTSTSLFLFRHDHPASECYSSLIQKVGEAEWGRDLPKTHSCLYITEPIFFVVKTNCKRPVY